MRDITPKHPPISGWDLRGVEMSTDAGTPTQTERISDEVLRAAGEIGADSLKVARELVKLRTAREEAEQHKGYVTKLAYDAVTANYREQKQRADELQQTFDLRWQAAIRALVDEGGQIESVKCSRCGESAECADGCRDPLCPAGYEQDQADKAVIESAAAQECKPVHPAETAGVTSSAAPAADPAILGLELAAKICKDVGHDNEDARFYESAIRAEIAKRTQ